MFIIIFPISLFMFLKYLFYQIHNFALQKHLIKLSTTCITSRSLMFSWLDTILSLSSLCWDLMSCPWKITMRQLQWYEFIYLTHLLMFPQNRTHQIVVINIASLLHKCRLYSNVLYCFHITSLHFLLVAQKYFYFWNMFS